ncbi:PREDICTED: uncharacterized protein LOC105568957 isoform X1 [Vollenhovia emeryi]|uniref:uncharacterized protein LOC105568957 isoform X1 n=1 Tax=Vollenhovia emeryi TaxID=411798 RepID=UPI0005F503E1|nr:PREDICTED: uncharacterized protein LOC105568957 isoform X1 [Vollenhovia emeryi]
MNEPQAANDESSDESSGETTDGEQEKKLDALQSEEIEEIRSEGSGDDMDLDETIDSQIGVRVESERQQHHPSPEDDDEEQVNILDTLPLEGAPIEGQEVSEADLLGKPISKDSEDEDSMDNENGQSTGEEGGDGNKRHVDSDHSDSAKKKVKKDDGSTEGSTSECELKSEKKLSNMRRNIREVMDETQLDEATLSAQRQEMERLRRVQEQQRIIREVQRQIAFNRQNNKAQTRVISLLQGKQNQAGTTMISQSSSPSSSSFPSTTSPSSTQVRLPSTVLLKVNSGAGTGAQSTQMTSGMQAAQMQRRSIDSGLRWQKGRGGYQGAQTSISRVPNRSGAPNMLQQRIRMMTPSVSISPVVPKKEPMDRADYYSDSELSDIETEEAIRCEKQMHAARKISGAPKYQRPPKGKDVVTISSSSESSDDDCIVLSDPSGEEETDTEDDPSNSGMHTNDRYNIPDEHGRVFINVGHPENEPDVYLAPQVARIIKPHQIGGIRFLFDNIVETIERYKTSSGFGCILAHSMGLGKTLQVASFCDIFFRCTTAKTVLCIMPINTLQNWLAEFNMWLPYEDPATTAEKQSKATNVKVEPGTDVKHEVKEESCGNQSDLSNMSRPISTESAHRFGQEAATAVGASQQPVNVMPENPYANPHHGYEQRNMMPSYMQDPAMMNKNMAESHVPHMPPSYHQGEMPQNPLYNANPNPLSSFPDSMKSDSVNCHGMPPGQSITSPKFGMENQATGVMYPGMENRPQGVSMYPDMENRNAAAMYPGMSNHHPGPMYSNYNSIPGTFASYGSQTNQQELEREPKKENMLPEEMSLPSTEVNVKKEPEETIKKEEGTSTTKEELDVKKETIEKVKTPHNVDAPIGLEVRPRNFRLHILNDSHKTMTARAKVIQEWQSTGGVLLIGYELFRQLSLKKPNKAKRKRGQPFKDTVDVEEEDKNKGLLDEMHTALVNPGPDLVICDEGHRIKNSHASISMALKQMRTKRRIVLTGYPLQNNLLEYWCMVDFVRPNYLGTKSEFCNMFERPIQNGQCIDSTPQDMRLMRYRAHVLHALLEGFVQRRSHSVLQMSLPRKEEYILLVRMTTHQRKLYDTFMNQVVKTRAVPNPLKAFAVCCKIWNHPDILYHFLRKRQANEEDDLDLEETIGEKAAAGGKKSKARQPKGESKKAKKGTTIKNKPAASVQPNASSSSNDNAETESARSTPKPNNYTNYTMPVSNSGYSNSVPQGSYPPHGYQNYRPNDQNTYYRNDNSNHGEYNHGEFYNNQGQQRYGNQQQFQSYTQTSTSYNTSQGYANQSQNYMQPNDRSANHPQRYGGAAAGPDFRSDQNQGNNYEAPGMFPRQNYPYQEQQRNYTPNLNQGPSNYPQVPNQPAFQSQMPSQSANMPMPDYSYTANQNQNYTPTPAQANPMYPRNDAQPLQNSTMGYQASQQGQPPAAQTQTTGYMAPQQNQSNTSPGQNRGFSPNQQNQNLGLQNQSHSYASQQPQGVPLQGQGHGYPAQVNPPPPQTPHTFNQQSAPMSQTPSHGYMQPNQPNQVPIPQGPMRGYAPAPQGQMGVAQNQPNYPSNQPAQNVNAQNQTHRYPPDQSSQAPNPQNAVHGYNHHVVPQSAASNQAGQYSQPNQPGPAVPPSSQTHPGYPSNHPGPAAMPQNPAHRYGAPQQTQVAQNQPMAYPPNQQQSNPTLGQNDQLYPRPDAAVPQQTQTYAPTAGEFSNDRSGAGAAGNPSNNYTANQPQAQNPVMPNYPSDGPHQNPAAVGQIKDEPYYMQRNYPQQTFRSNQQCGDSYYRDQINPSMSRYPNNYFPPQNYPNQSYDYATTGHGTDMNPRPDESKTSQQPIGAHPPSAPCDKSSKDMTSSIGVQSQPLHQNNLSGVPSYNAEPNCQSSATPAPRTAPGVNSTHSPRLNQSELGKEDEREKEDQVDKDKEDKSDDEILAKDEEKDCKSSPSGKDDPGIPYDWATELMKDYVPELIDASGKMTLFFCILEEAIKLGDRVLAFSQSLFTLNLIEDFLGRNSLKHPDGQTDAWIKNVNYYRLDGSTSALEREKLINEFNNNPKIHLFLVSTRAGSLGINLVGANRAIVFDASWNPCHDTQAVCRVYRYGQQKPCFVYRLVTDNCLERKIYDRQISKQGMADRVVDQCNPDAHLSLKEATTLSWDWEEDSQVQDFSQIKNSYTDEVMHRVLERHSSLLTKQPFHHESLLVDRKDKKLSQAEKRLARRGYELEKMAANCSRPSYNYVPGNTATRAGGLQIRAIRGGDGGTTPKPVASVRPMQQRGAEGLNPRGVTGSRWIPAEVWQRQGMSAQEMTLPLDVVIPTNSPDKGSIVLKAGQRVMVLKSPKGIYMQLESGKIIAIRTALKLNQQKREEEPKKGLSSMIQRNSKPEVGFPLRNNSAISIIPKSSSSNQTGGRPLNKPSPSPGYKPFGDKEISKRPKPVTATAKPYLSQVNLTNQVSLSRLPKVKQEPMDHSTLGDNSNSSDGQLRTEQRVEEVRLEDVVAEVSSNTEYSPSNHTRTTNSDTDTSLPKSSEEGTQVYTPETVSLVQGVQTQHDHSEPEMPPTADKQCSPPEKEPPKPDALTNYGRPFHNQAEKREISSEDMAIEEASQVTSQMTPPQASPQVTPQMTPQVATQTHGLAPGLMSSLLTPSVMPVPTTMSIAPSLPVPSSMPPNMPPSLPSSMSVSSNMPPNIPSSMPISSSIPPSMPISSSMSSSMPVTSSMSPSISSSIPIPSSMPIPSSVPIPSSMPIPSSVPIPSSMPISSSVPVSSSIPVPSSVPVPSASSRGSEAPKSIADSVANTTSTVSVCTSTNITSPKSAEPTTSMRDNMIQGEPTPSVPQGYPYAQYPRYYDYSDPRSRTLSNPYGTYFPGVPPHTANPSSRLPVDTTKPQPDLGKPMDERNVMNVPTAYSSQIPSITAKTLTSNSATESKGTDSTTVTTTVASSSRDETHIPTAFSHPTSTRYPGPYPPGPYDPYSQHYPPAPGSSAAYPPGAPGYPAYGGPSYNTDYARMYSAFHGPPPPTDPYMHRGYAPPSSHPPNYYTPFPHPPPPYPNYSFLPYPNPNMSSEPQPPAQ